MALKEFDAAIPHLFPSLGPALMISMGYIDLGKWVAAVEGGAHFGFNLVSLALFFNCAAILCQYLATCIGMATGKNLAEICSEEYSKSTCILLGVQVEISIIISELTTLLGIAHGLNLLFEVEMLPCILLAAVCTAPLQLLVTFWDNFKAEVLYLSIAGIALVFYVSGVLFSQPELPLAVDSVFPRLNGESAYSLMALLGANIMAHNFYIHSSVVQKQRRQPNNAMNTLFHDHFFAILSIFSGIFLVNYVLMNSAAAVFSNADAVLNFQDVNLLMDQIFRSPIAPVAFFLVLFFSSQITALNWNIGGKVILTYFFEIKLSVWVHHVLVKALAVIPALYYTWIGGPEGIYQLLIFCQIILAMFLPSSVIPLFRVASSTFLMRAFKIPWYVEIFSLSVFLGVLAANAIFIMDVLFGNNSWLSNLHSTLVPHMVIFLIACTSFGLTLYLAVTPLKSASEQADTQSFGWNRELNNSELATVREFDVVDKIEYDVDHDSSMLESDTLEKPMESHTDESTLCTNIDLAETVMDSDHDSQQSVHNSDLTSVCSSPICHMEMSKILVDAESEEILGGVSVCSDSDSVALQKIEPKHPIVKDVEVAMDSNSDNNNNNNHNNVNIEESASLSEDSNRGVLPTVNFETIGFSNSPTEKFCDRSNGSGSLSTLSGLGRAARRQLSVILDEFWGHLFDFHGKLTQEASTRRFDALLGLDLKIVGSSLKADTAGEEFGKGYLPDLDRGSILQNNLRDYSSPRHKINAGIESPFGAQMGSQPYSHKVLDAHAENSFTNLFESNQRHAMYSSYSSDNRDFQPATIHGYQMSSYLRGVGADRTPYFSNDSVGLPPTSSATSFIANHRDPVMFNRAQSALNSLGTSGFLDNPATARISRLQVERPCYKPSFVETRENVVSSSYEKKYHSSPDISALIASIRNSSLNYGNVQHAQWGGPTSIQPSVGRMAYEQSQYLNCLSRAGVSLAFNELSPPKLHTDAFSSYSSLNPDSKSLWSRQPFEQLFGMHSNDQAVRDTGVDSRVSVAPRESSHTESETKILQYLISCIRKLLKLEGSDWLFRQNGGVDEELIDKVAAAEKFLHEAESGEMTQVNRLDQHVLERKNGAIQRNEGGELAHLLSITNCGDGCIWRPAVVVSFGVWCIRRILELSIVESRPELWGKYTYVLNRLQGILEPAFSKPRHPLIACSCLKIQATNTNNSNASMQNGVVSALEKASKVSVTTAPMILEMIRDVETAVSGRKGRTGTAAGDVAFPKGKENLVSVLKRYKRRLSNKPPVTNESGSLSRRISSPASASPVL
ncbi:Ethylene-insensitive protein 2 [Dioscorea alata]|uniref:Ethylene-insensitive protein 2 n=3 Tax=Dioscorea alata TaxID=55571 RepID=A0ACB7VMJ8_DIOAL|nr:Ethylene-insensitive protein 2 [Dioscorea alata]KAH7675326.1 Ethylene-insensitive protein 2 [Dioscorea alata]KAH7675327.1 Ethylene-insensitive protein 2 [Dioscorea alata]